MSRFFALNALFAATFLVACSGVDVKPAPVNPTDMPKGPGLFSGESGNILDAFKNRDGSGGLFSRDVPELGVNAYLWKATLDTVSFMPLIQADSTGGVVVTDWYTNPSRTDEQIKLNILITGQKLTPEALKITLFKRTKDNGVWQNVPSDAATARQLEDIILTKARAYKVSALNKE